MYMYVCVCLFVFICLFVCLCVCVGVLLFAKLLRSHTRYAVWFLVNNLNS